MVWTTPERLMHINGSYNSVMANHFSEVMEPEKTEQTGTLPVIIHVVSGKENFISNNHFVVTAKKAEDAETTDSCYMAQVGALLETGESQELSVITVKIEKESVRNTVLDSGSMEQVILDRKRNAFRPIPMPEM